MFTVFWRNVSPAASTPSILATCPMAMVKAIVAMAKAIDADIVVEGIETEAMLQGLRDLGCDYAQGYLIGKPQTLEELLG